MADVADIVSRTQSGAVPTAEEFAALLAAVENTAVPVNVRVRALPVLAQHVDGNQSLLTKVVAAMVKLLDEELTAVHTAVVKALAELCTTASKFLEAQKMTELIRDASDVLFQMSMDGSGFAPEVRKAAKEAITTNLAHASVLGVAVKAIHLLSNDRWNDEAPQLEAERRGALDLLKQLTAAKNKELWSEDSEMKLLKVVAQVLPVVSAGEMTRLLEAIGQLPSVAAKEGAPLVEQVLKLKTDSPRGLEAIAKLNKCMPKDAVNDAIIDKVMPLLTKAKSSDASATAVGRALVSAARHASSEKADKHIASIRTALAKNGGESWTYTEALLAALAILANKNTEAFAAVLADDTFVSTVTGLAEQASDLELRVLFAAKKAAAAKEENRRHAEAVACLKHIVHMGAFVAVRKAPELTPCSWEGAKPAIRAPAQKRITVDGPLETQGKRPQPRRK
jgi:hypothetical protein